MDLEDFTGSLECFHLGQILRFLQETRATGRLELTRSDERAELFVEDGRTLFARTSGSTMRVGDVLVHQRAAPAEAIELILAVQRDQPGARIGQMLIESGALTETEIRTAVLAVQRTIVFGLLRWPEGRFRFLPGERVEGEDIRLELDLDGLLTGVLSLLYGSSQGRSRAA